MIDVILPSYRHLRFLPERVRSIDAQTRPANTCHIVDDASGDGSAEFLSNWVTPLSKTIEINAVNSGNPFAQWARALAKSSADFIWIAESDDTCEPTFLERTAAILEKNPKVGMVVAQSTLIDEDGNALEETPAYLKAIHATHWNKDYISKGTEELREFLILRNTVPNASGCLFRRQALVDADLSGIPYRLCGDWLAYARVLLKWDIAFIAKPLNRFRVHDRTVRAQSDRDGFRLLETYRVQAEIDRMIELTPSQKEKAAGFSFKEWSRASSLGTAKARQALNSPELLAAARAFDPHFDGRRDSFNGPDVSIITPFFNPGAVFLETMDSVLAQTWGNWEWLIVDDASTDSTSLELLERARVRDSRTRIFRLEKNSGPSAARNRALAEAKGEFLLLLDADDLLDPTFMEKTLWRLLTAPNWTFTKGYTRAFGATDYIWKNGFHDGAKFLLENRIVPTSLVRTAAAREAGGFDEMLRDGLEDWDFWLRLASKGHWGGTIPEILDHYRRRPEHETRWKALASRPERRRTETAIRARYPRLRPVNFLTPTIAHLKPETWCELGAKWRLSKRPERPRILIILPHLEMGGADRLNLDLLAFWVKVRGFEATVVTTRPCNDPWLEEFSAFTKDIFCLPRFLPIEAFPAFMEHLVATRGPRAIFLSHSEVGYHLLPWLRAIAQEIPIMDLVHIIMTDWKSGGYPRMSVAYQNYIDTTIATSGHLKQWMIDQGGSETRVQVVYTGIDTEKWKRPVSSAAKPAGSAEPVRLLFAARFAEQKNPRLLLPLVLHLKQTGIPFTLRIAGDGPDRHWMERELFKPHKDVVTPLGSLGPEAIRDEMLAADILLLPSASEGIALVLFEAMSLGLPFVATDVGGQRELVTPECGVLIAADEKLSENFNRELERLMRDPSTRRTMTSSARKRVEDHFTFAKTAANTTSILLQRRPDLAPAITTRQVDMPGIMKHLSELGDISIDLDEWSAKTRQGFNLVRLSSITAGMIRKTPVLGPWFVEFEHKHGEKIGRMLLKKSSG